MNILVAGIHGVGKTHLASRVATRHGLLYTSASKLIQEERGLTTWTVDKHVSGISENQIALASAVRRHNAAGRRLLMDGHFVLLDTSGAISPIHAPSFESLRLNGVLLLEAAVETVLDRVEKRDGRRLSAEQTRDFLDAERSHAQQVCRLLDLDLIVLMSPSLEGFSTAISHLSNSKK